MLVTMRCNADAPVSWVPAPSFHMEHAVTLLSIGQHEWPEDTNPRTDAPVRFIPRTRHPALLARNGFNPGSFTIRWA